MNKLIVIGGSAGSFRLVSDLFSRLPENYPWPLIVCLHRLKTARKGFKEALELNSTINIREPFDKEMIKASTAYIVPANYHLLVEYGHRISLSVDRAVNHSRPSIDVTMETAAEIFKKNTLGILLSGANMDGAFGMKQIHNYGGTTIVQDPEEAEIKTMPETVLKIFKPDHVLGISKIIDFLLDLKN